MAQTLESFVAKNRLFLKLTVTRSDIVISDNRNSKARAKRYRQKESKWSIEIIPPVLAKLLFNPIYIKKDEWMGRKYTWANGLTYREARSELIKKIRGTTLVFPDLKAKSRVDISVKVPENLR